MTSTVEQNLVEGNRAYGSTFKDGHLALPPSQKYAVGKFLGSLPYYLLPAAYSSILTSRSDLHGRAH
jgi:hypothetical protein